MRRLFCRLLGQERRPADAGSATDALRIVDINGVRFGVEVKLAPFRFTENKLEQQIADQTSNRQNSKTRSRSGNGGSERKHRAFSHNFKNNPYAVHL